MHRLIGTESLSMCSVRIHMMAFGSVRGCVDFSFALRKRRDKSIDVSNDSEQSNKAGGQIT
jgi:hypothetical protein